MAYKPNLVSPRQVTAAGGQAGTDAAHRAQQSAEGLSSPPPIKQFALRHNPF
jgi:hypothetical protein